MQVYDWVVLVVVAAFAVRGWRRGLMREVVELGVLFVGTILVFRLSPIVGAVIAGMANIPSELARVLGGLVILVALVVGAAFVSRLLSISMKIVPGASTINRLGGTLVGMGYAVLIVVLATTLLTAAPLPTIVRDSFDSSVQESVIGSEIVAPGGLVQTTFSSVSGEQIFGAVISVRDAVGDRLMVGTLPIPLPGVGDDRLVPSQAAAQQVFDEVNAERIKKGVDPLGWSSELAIVSVSRANNVYRSGVLRLDDGLEGALEAEGIPGTIHDEMLAIAASPNGLAEALVSSTAYEAMISDPQFKRAGVGVVEGPYGLIVVQVLSG